MFLWALSSFCLGFILVIFHLGVASGAKVTLMFKLGSFLGEGGKEEASGGGGGEGGIGALPWHHPQGCRQNPDRKVKGPKH